MVHFNKGKSFELMIVVMVMDLREKRSAQGGLSYISTQTIGINNALKSRLLTDEAVDKWEEYKQLEEQGRLIKLPCKVGDTVYVPTRDFISELRIAHITISKNNTFFHWMLNAGIYPNLDGFSVDKIGKTVFFTKSEAEAKLKELRGGENDQERIICMVGLKRYDNRRQEKWDVYVRLQQMSIMAGDAA